MESSKKLYAHQMEDADRFDHCVYFALLNEQGTGKTATLLEIAARKYRRGEINALLIIAPNGVHRQWAAEQIPQWLPEDIEREVMCYGGRGGAQKFRPFYKDNALQIVCVNIDTFSTVSKWKPVPAWSNLRKTLIVIDEAVVIKNIHAKRTERILYSFSTTVKRGRVVYASKPLSAARAILTGTPVTNGPTDLWSMFEFLCPNYFHRNWYSFQTHFGMYTSIWIEDNQGSPKKVEVKMTEEIWKDIHDNIFDYREALQAYDVSLDTFNCIHAQSRFEGPYKHADELKRLIDPVSSFRLLTDCVDMPEQVYIRKTVDMGKEQSSAYRSMEEELMAEYKTKVTTAANAVTAIIRLQQISSGFISTKQVVEDEDDILPNEITWFDSVPKLDELYRDIDESAKPVIVLTRFTAEAARIYDELTQNYRCCLMTGWKKAGTIEEYQAGLYDVMVANIRVVSRGFNLQNGHKLLFYSNTFSLEDRLQAEGRIFRIGQKEVCAYIDYAALNTVDMKITAALRQKRNLLDYVRGVNMTDFLSPGEE
jgi:SNF2 family DNA or RNA helicase